MEQQNQMVETVGTNEPTTAEEALLKIDQDAIKVLENHVQDPNIDAAAQFFKIYINIFKNVTANLSKRQLLRLLHALIEVPLADKEFKHKEGAEKQAYHIGDRLIQAKYTMMYFVLSKQNEGEQNEQEVQTDSSGSGVER